MKVKVRFLIIAMAIMVPVFLQAQPIRITQLPMSDDVVKTIIREYGFPASISYVGDIDSPSVYS